MSVAKQATVILAAVIASACSTNNRRPELRQLVDEIPYTLRQSVDVAVTETGGVAERATLVTGADPLFAIATVATGTRSEVRVSATSGEVLSASSVGQTTFDCPDAIALGEALVIAEGAAEGEAIQSVPDDDVECAFEIQVLAGDRLIEVKVAPDGAVLEVEPSDEFGGEDDD